MAITPKANPVVLHVFTTDENSPQIAVSGSTPLPTKSVPGTVVVGALGVSRKRFPTSALLLGAVQAVKITAGTLLGMKFINPNAVPIYVKFFNATTGNVTLGTTIPIDAFEIPANDGTNNGQLIITPSAFPLINFDTAISIIATSVLSDTGAQTAPGTGLLGSVDYA